MGRVAVVSFCTGFGAPGGVVDSSTIDSISPALPLFLLVAATGIAGVWIVDLVRGDKIDVSKGIWRLRELDTGQRLLPHLLAEILTSGLMVVAGVGWVTSQSWARDLTLIALGALAYTSLNSLSWVLTDRSRWIYGVPMGVTLLGAAICLVYLV